MRTAALLVFVALIGLPATARADCPLFGAGSSACLSAKPLARADFAKMAAQNAEVRQMTTAAKESLAAPAQPADVPPIDCRMVKPVDPQFKSAMPVITPDKGVKLPMSVVTVPSCKPQK
jgi:hypothetical protein